MIELEPFDNFQRFKCNITERKKKTKFYLKQTNKQKNVRHAKKKFLLIK